MTGSSKSKRYFDQRISDQTVFVLPGHHYVQVGETTSISTLLGSCVSACIRDSATRAGGLNHFLLPEGGDPTTDIQSSRYGVHAMEVLINDLLKMGAKKADLQAKIFGGAQVIETSAFQAVGQQNGDFVKDFLKAENIPIMAEDLGGKSPRRVYFFPETGRVSVLRIISAVTEDLQEAEMNLRSCAQTKQSSGGVELF